MTLDPYQVFSSADLLTQVALERMLAGVATRRHGLVAELIGETLEAAARATRPLWCRGGSQRATVAKLSELLGRDLSGLDVGAMKIDRTYVVARKAT